MFTGIFAIFATFLSERDEMDELANGVDETLVLGSRDTLFNLTLGEKKRGNPFFLSRYKEIQAETVIWSSSANAISVSTGLWEFLW